MKPDMWWDKSWSPITGCTPISESCEHCWAAAYAKRFWGDRKFGDVQFHSDRLKQPFYWRKPRRIFVCNMGDIFHNDVSPVERARVFATMKYSPLHTFYLLTKRPQNIKITAGQDWPKHIWLGVTVENQQRADERIPILLQVPAAHKFISIEPILERMDIYDYLIYPHLPDGKIPLEENTLDWVILGSETGPGARPCSIWDMIDVAGQCRAAGVPLFVKAVPIGGRPCRDMAKFPRELQKRELP